MNFLKKWLLNFLASFAFFQKKNLSNLPDNSPTTIVDYESIALRSFAQDLAEIGRMDRVREMGLEHLVAPNTYIPEPIGEGTLKMGRALNKDGTVKRQDGPKHLPFTWHDSGIGMGSD